MASTDSSFMPSNRLEQLLYSYTGSTPSSSSFPSSLDDVSSYHSSTSSSTSSTSTTDTSSSSSSSSSRSSTRPTGYYPLVFVILLASVLRMAMFSLPHSGQGKLPIGGDYEAQRHWMEITVNLPVSDWYIHTVDNDLLYWGLDYPPLTAYVSYLFGKLAQYIVPELVIMKYSRLNESSEGKLFMRNTVLLCDWLVWFPSIYLLLTTLYNRYQRKMDTSSFRSLMLFLFPLYFHPTLLIIDHGHFQYNNVSLGLTIGALYCLSTEYYSISAIMFTLALNYKQMSLYHALVFFVYLLAIISKYGPRVFVKPFHGYSFALVHRMQTRSLFSYVFAFLTGVFLIGSMVITTFAALWLPFCFYTPSYGMGGCTGGLRGVWNRMFPMDRNIFEDKVANLWCTLEPFTKFRQYLSNNPVNPDEPWSDHTKIAIICAITTFALSLPSLALLLRAGTLPLLPNQQTITIPLANVPPANKSKNKTDTNISLPENATTTTLIPSFVEHGILSLGNVGLAFFLSAYQVHEKSILLAVIPYSILYSRFPLFSVWFTVLSTFSMWPLLLKDNLLWPALALVLLYTYVLFPFSVTRNDVSFASALTRRVGEEARCIFYAVALLFPSRTTNASNVSKESVTDTYYRIYKGCKFIVYFSFVILFAQSIATLYVPAPSKLPDIHAYLSAVSCCFFFGIALVWGTVMQLGWVYERITLSAVNTDNYDNTKKEE